MVVDELIKKIKNYEKLATKNYYLYQESGDPRYERAYNKYDELVDVYRAAYKYQLEYDESLITRLHNADDYIKHHIKEINKSSYTKEEVLQIAENIKQFVF